MSIKLPEIQSQRACRWVDNRLHSIRRFIQKYLPYSPYQEDDFIAQAYLSAMEAEIQARTNCRGFEYYFWVLFRQACREMTYTRGQKIPCYHEEYLECGFEETPPTKVPEEMLPDGRKMMETMERRETGDMDLTPAEEHVLINKALDIMRPLERLVWRYLLQGYRICEIARMRGCSRQRIQKLRDNGLRRVRKYFNGMDS